ncbi:Tubulin-tyrosine ligase [Mactra antiquata]
MKRNTISNKFLSFVVCIGLLVITFNLYQLHLMRCQHTEKYYNARYGGSNGTSEKRMKKPPVVWIHGNKKGILHHVKIVFEKLGFAVSSGERDWDVLWAFDNPFIGSMSKLMTQLEPHQRVNHFPGTGYITNEARLLSLKMDSLPKTFRIPKDEERLLQYANEYPDTKWVRKNTANGEMKIIALNDLEFVPEGYIVQEFVDKPFLIEGRKFDIGVYTVLTSLSPLRVYTINDEHGVRFCPNTYHPFDPLDLDKYVMKDNYTPIWQIQPFEDYFDNKKFSIKESFNRYMISQGKNVSKMWSDIHEIIRDVYLRQQPQMMAAGSKFNSQRNYFELHRFDFILDDQMNVYLMGVKYSPKLSSGNFKDNIRLEQHIIYNALRVSRVASMIDNHFHNSDDDTNNMISADRDVMVYFDWCSDCHQCQIIKCMLCKQCLNSQKLAEIKDAYLEHYNRGGCKRIFPPELNQTEAQKWTPETDFYELWKYNDENKFIYVWFIGMCRKDVTFCI